MVDKSQAQEFVNRWKAALEDIKDKSGESKLYQTFWNDLSDLITGSPTDRDLEFQKRTASGGFIDVFSSGKFIVEQKSKGKSLDDTGERQGEEVTPFQQAKRYDDNLVADQKVKTIVTSNFEQFWFYDLMTNEGITGNPCTKITLEEIPDNLGLFKDLFGGEKVTKQENAVDKADEVASIAAELRKALETSVDQAESRGASEEKCNEYKRQIPLIVMRIIFLLFADNTSFNEIKLFDNQPFREFIKIDKVESDLRHYLLELFKYLNTPKEDRANGGFDSIISDLDWPYIDGGLFEKSIDFPEFSVDVFKKLKILSDYRDWDEINISNYGYLMDKSFPYDARRGDGVYFTSRENIQKVINPLFMDGLRAEFRGIKEVKDREDKQEKLEAFHDKLSRLQFFDPACGSGNFLTETYLELRSLEDEVIHLECGDNPIRNLDKLIQVTLSQFHGIELDPYTAQIARTALQIAHEQALSDSYKKLNITIPPQFFPLKRETNGITNGNSLEMNWGGDPEKKWNGVTPSENLYIFGNPPYKGFNYQTSSEKKELDLIFGKKRCGYLDYCTAWTFKAAKFLNGSGAQFAFVTTSSIVQGSQVTPLFKQIFGMGWKFSFAYPPFKWDRNDAHPAVVITGMAQNVKPPYLLWDESEEKFKDVENISQYLNDFPTVFIRKENSPISDLPECRMGAKKVDGGGLLLKNTSEKTEAEKDPVASKYIRTFLGGDELTHNKERWCIWITPEIYERDKLNLQVKKDGDFLENRLAIVENYRLNSPKLETRKVANIPYSFQEVVEPTSQEKTLAIPEVFKPDRKYFTAGYLSKGVVFSNKLYVIEENQELSFSIVESAMFKAWQDWVGGRYGTANCFSNTLVWNTFPLPKLTKDQRDRIIEAGTKVLEARAGQKKATLEKLYNPTRLMPPSLQKAHEALDKAVDSVFSDKPLRSEEERQKALLEAYKEMTGEKAGE